jgi:hypothetical protein
MPWLFHGTSPVRIHRVPKPITDRPQGEAVPTFRSQLSALTIGSLSGPETVPKYLVISSKHSTTIDPTRRNGNNTSQPQLLILGILSQSRTDIYPSLPYRPLSPSIPISFPIPQLSKILTIPSNKSLSFESPFPNSGLSYRSPQFCEPLDQSVVKSESPLILP